VTYREESKHPTKVAPSRADATEGATNADLEKARQLRGLERATQGMRRDGDDDDDTRKASGHALVMTAHAAELGTAESHRAAAKAHQQVAKMHKGRGR
jgi:hypothetical protein